MNPKVRNALVATGKVALGFVCTAIFLVSVSISLTGHILQGLGEQGLRLVRWGLDAVDLW